MSKKSNAVLETVNKGRLVCPRDPSTWCDGVRAYRGSPEDVVLQVRLGKRFATISLSFDEARELGFRLVDAANNAA